MKSLIVELGRLFLFEMAKISAITFRACTSVSRPSAPSSDASSNLLAILLASCRSAVFVERWVLRPSGKVKQAIQYGELGNRRNEAINSYNIVTT
jgi:hypothetical protein